MTEAGKTQENGNKPTRLFGGVERLLQFGDIVIEKMKIVGDLFFAAHGRGEDDDLGSGFAGHGLGRLEVEIGLDDDDLDALALHQLDELEGVLGAGGNAGARLDVARDVEVEVAGEIGPGAVVGDDLAAGVGVHLGFPLLRGLVQALLERGVTLGEIVRVGRTHLGELVLDALSDAESVFRVEPVMGIALGMDVAFGAGDDASGNFEDAGEARGVEIALRAGLDARIAGLGDERRQPSDFQLEADDDEKVGFAELEEKTGLGFDEVRILIAAGNGFHIHAVAADFLDDGGEIGGGRDDPGFGGRGSAWRERRSSRNERERNEGGAETNCDKLVRAVHGVS